MLCLLFAYIVVSVEFKYIFIVTHILMRYVLLDESKLKIKMNV